GGARRPTRVPPARARRDPCAPCRPRRAALARCRRRRRRGRTCRARHGGDGGASPSTRGCPGCDRRCDRGSPTASSASARRGGRRDTGGRRSSRRRSSRRRDRTLSACRPSASTGTGELGGARGAWDEATGSVASVGFPDSFWWGTAASSTQCEGAAPATDWARWERLGKAPPSGDGNGFATRYAEDFALLASCGLAHHRLSIEWARIEPRQGERDPDAVEHERTKLLAARAAGIEPWVCLHHFTLPGWFADDLHGFLDEKAAGYWWPRHVDFCAETFGDLVAGWMPINEPVAYAVAGFLSGEFPPGRRDVDDFRTVLRTIHRAKRDAARLLRGGGAPAVTIHNLSPVYAADPSPQAKARAARVDDVIWRSWADPDLLEPFDLLGFSYYNAFAVTPDGLLVPYPAGAETGPLGYAPWSAGL